MSILIKINTDEFFDVVNKGIKNRIIEFINGGVDINAKNKHGRTALMMATLSKSVTKLLIKHGSNVHAQDNDGNTALTLATIFHMIGVVEKLIKNGSNVNHENNLGETPLWIAMSRGHFIIAKILIDNGADVNVANFEGQTMLMEATKSNNIWAIEQLFNYSKNIRLFALNDKCETALDIALKQGNIEIINLLERRMKIRINRIFSTLKV